MEYTYVAKKDISKGANTGMGMSVKGSTVES